MKPCAMARIRSQSSFRYGQLTIESYFLIIFLDVKVRNEGPAPSCSRIVALSFSTLCLRISQLYFSMEAEKGYNSVVECHLDVVEVISSSLVIPKPNVSFSIFTCSPAMIE